jgi:L,D-transpeptidase catalytic domain
VVHQPFQAFGAYEHGRLVRWGPVSTGRRENPTPHGIFNLTWKAKQRRSTDNEAWLLRWYFNFINARGISFHQFDLPGYAASHACVRLLERDAEWLYGWGEQWKLDESGTRVLRPGTTVVVIGAASRGAPWTSLELLQQRLELPPLPFWILMPGLSLR